MMTQIKRVAKVGILDQVMNEAIQMPGCPGLIVTRHEAFVFLKSLGYETDTRKTQFGSVDYMVFSKKPVNEPLSEPAFREKVFAAMRAHA